MTTPPRLLDTGTDFERGLLASARRDAGSAESLDRLLAAMGGAATAAAPRPVDPGALEEGAVNAIGGGAAPVVAGAGAAIVTRWSAIAVAALVVAGAAALSIQWAVNGRPTHLATPPSPVTAAPESSAPPIVEMPAAAPLAATPLPAATASVLAPPSVAASPSPARAARTSALRTASSTPGSTATESSMDAELALLSRVRSLLAGGHPSDALQALDAHDQAFPASAFAEEAVVLRVEALAAQGNHAAAAAAARRLLAEDPTSAHAAHLLRVLRAGENL